MLKLVGRLFGNVYALLVAAFVKKDNFDRQRCSGAPLGIIDQARDTEGHLSMPFPSDANHANSSSCANSWQHAPECAAVDRVASAAPQSAESAADSYDASASTITQDCSVVSQMSDEASAAYIPFDSQIASSNNHATSLPQLIKIDEHLVPEHILDVGTSMPVTLAEESKEPADASPEFTVAEVELPTKFPYEQDLPALKDDPARNEALTYCADVVNPTEYLVPEDVVDVGISMPVLAEESGDPTDASPEFTVTEVEVPTKLLYEEYLPALEDDPAKNETLANCAAVGGPIAAQNALSLDRLSGTNESTPVDESQEASYDDSGPMESPDEPESSDSSASRPSPRRYRPPREITRRTVRRAPTRAESQRTIHDPKRSSTFLPINVHVLFVRGGTCSVSLLPSRTDGMPISIAVDDENAAIELRAFEESMYQDVFLETLGARLHEGITWQSIPDHHFAWSLSGRDVFVLGEGRSVRGYVSQPRLQIGRDQVVLCSDSVSEAVAHVLHEAGSGTYEILPASSGAPDGWKVLKGVKPIRPVPMSSDTDILNVLRPAAEMEIDFSGGVNFSRNVWLAGNPPHINVYGATEADEIYIDGKIAKMEDHGYYQCDGWESIGPHIVSSPSGTRSYVIAEVRDTWDLSPEQDFTLRQLGDPLDAGICGPLVFTRARGAVDVATPLIVPSGSPMLIGKYPGEVYMARSPHRHSLLLAWPPFKPVWALPKDPLHADRAKPAIHFLGDRSNINNLEPSRDCSGSRTGDWQRVILDSARKRLHLDDETTELRSLWSAYVNRARGIWRSGR